MRVDLVTETGDVAVRGGLVDVFPPDLDEPVRIEFDLNAVASLRSFDPDTQRSTGALSAVALPPMALTPDTRRDARGGAARARGLPDGRRRPAGAARPLSRAPERRTRGDPPASRPRTRLTSSTTPGASSSRWTTPTLVALELVRAADVLALDYEKARAAGASCPTRRVSPGTRTGCPGGRRARPRRARAGGAGGRGGRDRSGVRPLLRGPPPGRAEGDRARAAGRPRRRPRRRRRRANASTSSACSPSTRSTTREGTRTWSRRSRRARAASFRAVRARDSCSARRASSSSPRRTSSASRAPRRRGGSRRRRRSSRTCAT